MIYRVLALALLAGTCGGHETSLQRDSGADSAPRQPSEDSLSASVPQSSDTALLPAPACASANGTRLLALIYDHLLTEGNTRATVRQSLGQPRTETATLTPNRHLEEQIDTLIRWTYGASHYLFLVAGGHELLLERRVPADNAALGGCVTLLSTPSAAASVLGVPILTSTRADTLVTVYEVRRVLGPGYDAGFYNTIALHYVGGRLAAVEANPFVD